METPFEFALYICIYILITKEEYKKNAYRNSDKSFSFLQTSQNGSIRKTPVATVTKVFPSYKLHEMVE